MASPPVPTAQALPAELQAEIALLPPVAETGPPGEAPPTLLDHSAAFVKQVARVGKQQMKTAQEVSLLSAEVQAIAAELRRALQDKEEVIEMLRRERDGLAGQNDLLLRELLSITDLFDHALQFAQKQGDRRWIEELERLDKGMMQMIGRLGLREIPALGLPFDPTLHEVVETLPRGKVKKSACPDAQVHDIVEVTQRGFHQAGVVVRRSRVVTVAAE